jgi:DNA-binding winged helix-turn-helix (wHTH) protein
VNALIRFGDFVLDLDARELRCRERAVALSPKAFQLLEILVGSRPKALSKVTLQERLWPDTFVVEKNLVNLVAEIREALGDRPARPRFIRTVHRFGYAFRDEATLSAGQPRGNVRCRLEWKQGRASIGVGEYVLGRDPDLELFLDSPRVSRRHAVITVTADGATVEDLGSKNGTFVADRRVEAATPLADGDVIRVGAVLVTFTVVATWGSTHTETHAPE